MTQEKRTQLITLTDYRVNVLNIYLGMNLYFSQGKKSKIKAVYVFLC